MLTELPDFDTLKELAERDPEALEKLRNEHVSALINSAPEEQRRRLRGLQFQIDSQRKIHTNPMSACVKISQMMHDSFAELRYVLNEITDQGPKRPQTVNSVAVAGQVLQFRNS